jgi:tetratricopeptide (TPR) repeat protein
LEARVKELETLLKSEEDRNIEIDKNFKKALYDLTCESQKVQSVMARANKLWNISMLQFYYQKYENTLGQITRLKLPYENCSDFFTDTNEIRIASMSSIMANGALITGDYRAAEEFYKEAVRYTQDEFTAHNLAHGMNILVNLANFAASMVNFDEVIIYLRRIVQLADKHPDIVAAATKNFKIKCRRAGIVEDKDIDEDFMIYQSLANAVDWLILFSPEDDVNQLITISETKTRLRPTSVFLFILYSLREVVLIFYRN